MNQKNKEMKNLPDENDYVEPEIEEQEEKEKEKE
jgi:hypothetical protein